MKSFNIESLKPLIISLAYLALLFVLVQILRGAGFGFSYQDSISMPEGWYASVPVQKIHRNEIILFQPPAKALPIMLQHHWILPDSQMMKTAQGLPGDFVCIRNHALWINHHRIAAVESQYKPGHPLPHLSLCRRLDHNEYMMISTHIPNSFDSRYFGPIKRKHILARAIKL